jgi:hypothetical protein
MGSDVYVSAWCPCCLFLAWAIRRIYHAEDGHKGSGFAFVLPLFVAEILASLARNKEESQETISWTSEYLLRFQIRTVHWDRNNPRCQCAPLLKYGRFSATPSQAPALLFSSIEINLTCGPQSRVSTAYLLQWNKSWKVLIGFETSPFMLKLLAL